MTGFAAIMKRLKAIGVGSACIGFVGSGVRIGLVFVSLIKDYAINLKLKNKLFNYALLGAGIIIAIVIIWSQWYWFFGRPELIKNTLSDSRVEIPFALIGRPELIKNTLSDSYVEVTMIDYPVWVKKILSKSHIFVNGKKNSWYTYDNLIHNKLCNIEKSWGLIGGKVMTEVEIDMLALQKGMPREFILWQNSKSDFTLNQKIALCLLAYSFGFVLGIPLHMLGLNPFN